MHVDHIGTYVAGAIEQKTHSRQTADRRVLAAGIENVDVDRIAPHGDRCDFDNRVGTDAGIVTRILAEGPLLPQIFWTGVQYTFDDDLGACQYFKIYGLRRHHLQRLLQQSPRDLQLTTHARRISRTRKQQAGMMADHHRHLHRQFALAVLNEDIVSPLKRAGHKTNLVLTVNHRTINAGILHAGFWIAQNKNRRGDVLAGIELLVAKYRQFGHIGLFPLPDNLFHRRLCSINPLDRNWSVFAASEFFHHSLKVRVDG